MDIEQIKELLNEKKKDKKFLWILVGVALATAVILAILYLLKRKADAEDWDDDDWEDEDWDDEDECCCGHDHDDDELFDGGIYEITCPKCGEIVCMDEEMLFSPDCGCPNCGTSFEVDFDGVECCDDEDCCCHDHDEE